MSRPLEPRTAELVGIAAAVAGHCPSCFELHYRKALDLGLEHGEIEAALTLARAIRSAGDHHMDEFTADRMKLIAVEART